MKMKTKNKEAVGAVGPSTTISIQKAWEKKKQGCVARSPHCPFWERSKTSEYHPKIASETHEELASRLPASFYCPPHLDLTMFTASYLSPTLWQENEKEGYTVNG